MGLAAGGVQQVHGPLGVDDGVQLGEFPANGQLLLRTEGFAKDAAPVPCRVVRPALPLQLAGGQPQAALRPFLSHGAGGEQVVGDGGGFGLSVAQQGSCPQMQGGSGAGGDAAENHRLQERVAKGQRRAVGEHTGVDELIDGRERLLNREVCQFSADRDLGAATEHGDRPRQVQGGRAKRCQPPVGSRQDTGCRGGAEGVLRGRTVGVRCQQGMQEGGITSGEVAAHRGGPGVEHDPRPCGGRFGQILRAQPRHIDGLGRGEEYGAGRVGDALHKGGDSPGPGAEGPVREHDGQWYRRHCPGQIQQPSERPAVDTGHVVHAQGDGGIPPCPHRGSPPLDRVTVRWAVLIHDEWAVPGP